MNDRWSWIVGFHDQRFLVSTAVLGCRTGKAVNRILPVLMGVPQSGAFNAERGKPVVDCVEQTQKTHQAVKGVRVSVRECCDDGLAGFLPFCVV